MDDLGIEEQIDETNSDVSSFKLLNSLKFNDIKTS
jgi:hypothetical protein